MRSQHDLSHCGALSVSNAVGRVGVNKSGSAPAAKPRVAYRDLAWMHTFELVKKCGEGSVLRGFTVLYINDDPAWIQVKSRDGKRMIRKGDEFIHRLIKDRA